MKMVSSLLCFWVPFLIYRKHLIAARGRRSGSRKNSNRLARKAASKSNRSNAKSILVIPQPGQNFPVTNLIGQGSVRFVSWMNKKYPIPNSKISDRSFTISRKRFFCSVFKINTSHIYELQNGTGEPVPFILSLAEMCMLCNPLIQSRHNPEAVNTTSDNSKQEPLNPVTEQLPAGSVKGNALAIDNHMVKDKAIHVTNCPRCA